MTSQPPLINPSGENIPSPKFSIRQSRNYNLYIYRTLTLALTFFIIWTFASSPKKSPAPVIDKTYVTPIEQNWKLRTAVGPGQGMTHAAAWAVDAYSTQSDPQIKLDAVEHLYAVDALARKTAWRPLRKGQDFEFSADDIAAIIAQAKSLSPAQRSAWSKLLR